MRGNKVRKGDKGFVTMKHGVFFDPRLSLKAKGLYAYLYAKPEDYDFSAKRIAMESTDGREAVLSAMNELVDTGYITRQKLGNGRMEYTIWFESKPVDPESANPTLGIPHPESAKPTVGKPHSGVSRLIIEEGVLQSTDERQNTLAPASGADVQESKDIVAVIEVFQSVNPTIHFGNKTQRSAALKLIRRFGIEKTLRSAKFAAEVCERQYAPCITTPTDLLNNIGKLIAYAKRNSGGRVKVS